MSAYHPRQSSVDLDSPGRPFDNIINFRDVGRTINQLVGKRVLKEGILFRSARLDDASERDKRRLTDELHIATIIDLRSSTEHQMATTKRLSELAAASSTSSTPPTSTTNNLHLIDLPEVRRFPVSLTGKAFERTLLWRLDWWNFFKVLALAASGYRDDAVLIVGQQVMSPRGLIGLGIDTLDSSFGEMKTIFDLFSTPTTHNLDDQDPASSSSSSSSTEKDSLDTPYPILIHCTQGKDRTGLIILLLLLLVADFVPIDAVAADYVRSEGELVIEMEERMKEVRLLGLSEEYTKCPDGFTGRICAHLEERYGGVEGYLGLIGIGREKVERIRRVLLA
ncbi:putative tyrosine/serine protein phosphatase [Aspergillus ibericus CBS 121593]|uniref:Tyrosine/serine protein phosphatase n=1 Tax=Aspergillus ibericus CBS 121593 TaxID=1448316 RepID=A0A395GS50_9EURO|nr:tyrosine/serine protein phosphatase [Aspergillus ibericus CBS 121593]RAK98355.1 tyrosine/serine protein phosphatase [Aspergillus ibericus CBS 121593]